MSIRTASPARSARRDGPRPCALERPGPVQRRLGRAGHAAAVAREHLPVEELAVDAAEADGALVAAQPHVVPELAQDVALARARDEQLRRVLHRLLALQAGGADARDLPCALARARRPQRRHAVPQLGARQELLVAEVRRGREHVELDAEPQPLGQAERGQRRGQGAQRRERLDAVEARSRRARGRGRAARAAAARPSRARSGARSVPSR